MHGYWGIALAIIVYLVSAIGFDINPWISILGAFASQIALYMIVETLGYEIR